ncbi:hypothetical protein IQ265_12750 [Nodosilinea sp. LEGE 06152]|uniref:hypothetical protein n=1 Tax=Nodosilinea sp. LEGE 06152 TaxID=2777966 RepID=UPI00187E8CC2|nr:hypothetical protein [Nodosilinea sp. LEGE 06152]MBE9157688.1 hypothetical protein [Nodosilinea sp. LEGE 06152]
MPLEVAIPLFLSLLTAAIVAVRAVVTNGAKAVVLLAQLKEKVEICLVGIEALRMVDTEQISRDRQLEQRLDDIERYLQLASCGDWPHPFQMRNGTRPGTGHD